MNQSADSSPPAALHFPSLAAPPPCSRPLSIQEYAEFSESLLAALTPESIQRQQNLRHTVTRRFRLVAEREARSEENAEERGAPRSELRAPA